MSEREGPPLNVIHSVQSAFVVVHGAAEAAAAINRLEISATVTENARFMRQTITRGTPGCQTPCNSDQLSDTAESFQILRSSTNKKHICDCFSRPCPRAA